MTNAAPKKKTDSTRRIRTLAFIGMFSAIAAVLMFLEFPLPFAPPFYKLDFSEIPVLIGTFSFGPVTGVVIELVKILVKTLIKGSSTAFVGEFANFLMGCALIVPAGIVYKLNRTRKGAVLGMVLGTASMTLASCLLNAYVLLPTYAAAFHMPMDALVEMGTAVNKAVNSLPAFVMLCVAPFNLLKGVVVSIITFLLYKRISRLIKTAGA